MRTDVHSEVQWLSLGTGRQNFRKTSNQKRTRFLIVSADSRFQAENLTTIKTRLQCVESELHNDPQNYTSVT